MHSWCPAFHDVSRGQMRQSFKPEAGCLSFSMPKLPRLNNLVWLADFGTDDPYWILDCYPVTWPCHQQAHELKGCFLVSHLVLEPSGTGNREMSTRRKRDDHIPRNGPDGSVANAHLVMKFAAIFSGKQITRPSLMPATTEGLSDDAGELTRDENAHVSPSFSGVFYLTPSPFVSV